MENRNDLAIYYFHQGTNFAAYNYLGCTLERDGNSYSYVFRVWAPNALSVGLVSDFSGWDKPYPMTKITDGGIFECTYNSNHSLERQPYKFRIQTKDGRVFDKADPYARFSRGGADGSSLIFADNAFIWSDDKWLAHRKKSMIKSGGRYMSMPVNIYEMHLGSFLRHTDGRYYSYRELCDFLPGYLKHLGYTHVEFLPLQEHPFDGSWGYQVCGFYAPTSRFGDPDEFRMLIDKLHAAGIGVILDWVPAHFPKDAWGLYEFDGVPLYEYQGKDRQESHSWGTRFFDLGREEVQSFLISNAMFWIEKYHVDGLRVDAVASMLYLDYDRGHGEWLPNAYGGNQCLEAVAFFKKLNACLKEHHPDIVTIAEESTAWPHVTGDEDDGLGFDMKWNMGWMNDTLRYAEKDPIYRKYHHENVTFPMIYAFSERFVLPLSHDEVVHGKGSLLQKMSGDHWQKLASLRAFLGYMMTLPGKKLSFMGNEIAQPSEWDFNGQVPWFLLDDGSHASMQHYVSELNHLYLETPALWQIDDSWDGFAWIDPDDRDRSIISYRRIDKQGREVLVAINFTPVVYEDFPLEVPDEGTYREIFNSDGCHFGGSGVTNTADIIAKENSEGDVSRKAICFRMPPLGMVILKHISK